MRVWFEGVVGGGMRGWCWWGMRGCLISVAQGGCYQSMHYERVCCYR